MITNADIPALRQLWQEAFGDSAEFLDRFFRVGFSYDRCNCVREAGKVSAALYWFDCLWQGKKVAYIYAVATAKALRGKGLCRRLMEDTHALLHSRGYAGAALVPANAGLVALYQKFGYREFCTVSRGTVAVENISSAQKISPEEYHALRQTLLGENALLQNPTALDFLATYGAFYKATEGLFCGYREGDTFHLEEDLGVFSQPQATLLAMYLPLDGDPKLPDYFAMPLN